MKKDLKDSIINFKRNENKWIEEKGSKMKNVRMEHQWFESSRKSSKARKKNNIRLGYQQGRILKIFKENEKFFNFVK